MKNNKCKNFSDFVDLVCDQYIFFKNTSEDFIGVSVIAHYEVMIDLINELVKNTDFSLINISIEDPEMDGYDREWVVTIDPDGYIWCEKVYRSGHGGYLYCDEDIVFVHEDVDNGFIKKNYDENIVIFSIGNEDEGSNNENDDDELSTEGCSDSVHISRDKDGTPIGFTKSKVFSRDGYTEQFSFSHYSDSVDFLKEIADVFGCETVKVFINREFLGDGEMNLLRRDLTDNYRPPLFCCM